MGYRDKSAAVDILSTFGPKGLFFASKRALIAQSRSVRQPFVSFEGNSPDAKNVLWVPTDAIQHFGTCLTRNQVEHFGAVYGGPWDTPLGRIATLPYYHSFKRHFLTGVPWDETYFYRDQLRNVRSSTDHRLATESELQDRLTFLDDLYERIREEGYKTQQELLSERPDETRRLNNDADEPGLNEIGVCIGRDGRFFKHGAGSHRLLIAKLLDVEEVPVQVRARHQKWERIRQQTGSELAMDDKHRTHPDRVDGQRRDW